MKFFDNMLDSVYSWPQKYRLIYARWWPLLCLPLLLARIFTLVFVLFPVAIYHAAKDHLDNIRKGDQ